MHTRFTHANRMRAQSEASEANYTTTSKATTFVPFQLAKSTSFGLSLCSLWFDFTHRHRHKFKLVEQKSVNCVCVFVERVSFIARVFILSFSRLSLLSIEQISFAQSFFFSLFSKHKHTNFRWKMRAKIEFILEQKVKEINISLFLACFSPEIRFYCCCCCCWCILKTSVHFAWAQWIQLAPSYWVECWFVAWRLTLKAREHKALKLNWDLNRFQFAHTNKSINRSFPSNHQLTHTQTHSLTFDH